MNRKYTWGANFRGCFPTFLSTLRQVTRSSEGRVNNKVPIKIRGEIGSKEDLLALDKFVFSSQLFKVSQSLCVQD